VFVSFQAGGRKDGTVKTNGKTPPECAAIIDWLADGQTTTGTLPARRCQACVCRRGQDGHKDGGAEEDRKVAMRWTIGVGFLSDFEQG
jgi:hypothetical protein